MTKEKMNYEDAVAEIESILQKIEGGQLDVDDLAKKVKRCTDLLKLCRDKLYQTEEQIGKILEEE